MRNGKTKSGKATDFVAYSPGFTLSARVAFHSHFEAKNTGGEELVGLLVYAD